MNLRVMLRPGISANPLAGSPAIPGVSCKFQNGLLEVKDEETQRMLLAHPAFETDFIKVEENEVDPFAHQREEAEPGHTTTEIKYGHVEKNVSTPRVMKFTPEMERYMNAQAVEIAKALIPQVMKSIADKEKAAKADLAEVDIPPTIEDLKVDPDFENSAVSEPSADVGGIEDIEPSLAEIKKNKGGRPTAKKSSGLVPINPEMIDKNTREVT